MSSELLVEIGTEEIPARFILPAIFKIKNSFAELLKNNRIIYKDISAFATPRRLIVVADSVADKQSELIQKIIGPPKRICFDEDNKPTRAAIGFAKNKGVSVDELKIEDLPDKGEYCVVYIKNKEKESFDLLQELIPTWIKSLSFPKLMRWGESDLKFVRPIHWILALFGGKIIPFSLGGIKSSDKSFGHRFLHPESLQIDSFADFILKMEKAYVIFDPKKREEMILTQAESLAKAIDGTIYKDQGLLDQVSNLVEYPNALCGSFDEKYLKLPKPVLITSMIDHQKYFPVVNKDGNLLPNFIVISNLPQKDSNEIVRGNERVIKARLADAEFFYNEDTKSSLNDLIPKLKQVIFQENLGNLHDKIKRVKNIALYIAKYTRPDSDEQFIDNLQRAAMLCKCDLLTQMVGEFPNLQGIMGRIYALCDNEPDNVAQAIEEHYLPRFSQDKLPETLEGSILSVAEKTDNLVACFAQGFIPTGSEDPHALRRQTLGIFTIAQNKNLPFLSPGLISYAVDLMPDKLKEKREELYNSILQFLNQRLSNYFLAKGYTYDLVDAVLNTKSYNPIQIEKQLKALFEFRQREEFENILIPFKRVINIIPKKQFQVTEPDINLFKEIEEKNLFNIFKEHLPDLEAKIEKGDYLMALQVMTALKDPIDSFFDHVLVMDKDEKICKNRLSLLGYIGSLFLKVADFSKIVT